MKNVLIIQRRMTEYRIPMFDALRHRLIENDINLQVVYGAPTTAESTRKDSGNLPWGIRINNHYLRVGKSHIVWQSIPRQLLADQDLIIMSHENSLLKNHFLLFQKRYHDKVKLAFWGHGANFQSMRKSTVRERFKAWTTRFVDWWFAYTQLSVEKLILNGFSPERITCLNNAIDVTSIQKWRVEITEEERRTLMRALGLRGTHLAIFLGGLYADKRLDFLCSSADELKRLLSDFELVIIGDGPQREMIRVFAASRPWCRWVGARHDREKVLYASLGQVMLNPGLVGLGILDSFALGIPLLTTDCGIHSPEISYLKSGYNGLMVTDDLQVYTKMAIRVLTDRSFRDTLANNCIRDLARYSLDNMVNNFSIGILKALSADKLKMWQRGVLQYL